jgi:hypothetical protein
LRQETLNVSGDHASGRHQILVFGHVHLITSGRQVMMQIQSHWRRH